MRPSFRAALGNALLLIISVGATYLVASFVIFRFLLPHLSFNLHPHFPDIAEVFAQTSKAGTVPRDYIALLGDSYAEGQGDGLIAAGGDRARFVHSAHVLHGLTRRDVVNLGLGGAGSVQAMVRQPARILMGDCFLYPRLDPPRRIFVYFYEGNDLEENGYIAGRVAAEGAVTRETIARYVGDHYGTPPKFRCFTDLGETTFKMAHFLITNADTFEALRKPSTRNNVFSGGTPHAAPALQKPPAEMEAGAREAALTVFDVSLEWLRRNFSAAVTLVYVPSPAAIYRPAEPSVDVYTRWPVNEVRAMPAADIYAASQRTCEQIRALALARGARFLDMRPALRAAAATTVIHGPQDWNHFNATGYRVLGETLARSIDEEQSTDCRDWHQPRAVLPSPGGGGSTRTQ
jgi:GDSL-like Lipase/Acylhydrolase family